MTKKAITKNKRLFAKLIFAFGLFTMLVGGFAAIADEVGEGDTLPYDNYILTSVNHLSSPLLDTVVVVITNLGGVLVVTIGSLLLVSYLVYKRKKYAAIMIMAGVGGSTLINLILKTVFERPRPTLWEHLVTEASFSFPSGHATASSALAFSVVAILWYTKWRMLAITLGAIYSISIGFSRLYLGVHYPTDILGGWLISLAWVMVVVAILYDRFRRKSAMKESFKSKS